MQTDLKVSRVAIWSRIAKLRSEGFCIEATQNKGYRIATEPKLINESFLKAWLQKLKTECSIFVLEKLDSTNSEAERMLANEIKAPFAIIANKQTSGRGRIGKNGIVQQVETYIFPWLSNLTYMQFD